MNKRMDDLSEFVDRAAKSRKYPESTAQGLRAALKLFDSVLNAEERDSLELFKNNLEQIYQSVSTKYGRDYSAGSLAAYKSRVLKVIGDYEKYGVDPTKMASWSPKLVKRGPRNKKANTEVNDVTPNSEVEVPVTSVGMHKIELALRPDKKFLVVVPMDITTSEATTLKAVLDSLVTK